MANKHLRRRNGRNAHVVAVSRSVTEFEELTMTEENKMCVAMICAARYWLPSLQKVVSVPGNVRVLDWPTDTEFIKNTGYSDCKLPGEVWDEKANIWAAEGQKSGWLCAFHGRGDKSVLPTVTLYELFREGT
jgi:hypothetical protein